MTCTYQHIPKWNATTHAYSIYAYFTWDPFEANSRFTTFTHEKNRVRRRKKISNMPSTDDLKACDPVHFSDILHNIFNAPYINKQYISTCKRILYRVICCLPNRPRVCTHLFFCVRMSTVEHTYGCYIWRVYEKNLPYSHFETAN